MLSTLFLYPQIHSPPPRAPHPSRVRMLHRCCFKYAPKKLEIPINTSLSTNLRRLFIPKLIQKRCDYEVSDEAESEKILCSVGTDVGGEMEGHREEERGKELELDMMIINMRESLLQILQTLSFSNSLIALII